MPFNSKPKRSHKGGAGKTVNRTRGILAIQDEGIGQQALDRARIDIGLIWHIATRARRRLQ